MTTWWEDPHPDWTRPEPKRALELLSHAYDERDAIKNVVRRAGIDWRRAPGGSASAWEIWTWALDAGAKGGLVFDLLSTVLEDETCRTFHEPLKKLLGATLARANSRTLARQGIESLGVVEGPVLATLGATLAGPDAPQSEGLQAVLNARTGLADPRGYLKALVDAMRRTALIEIGGIPKGTGFLVGADLMLTAAHVLDPRNWPPQLNAPVEAVFDLYAEGDRAPAEVGSRVRVIDFLEGSLPTDSEVQGGTSDWNAAPDRLDFALVRLARPVAAEHGPNDAWPGAATRGSYAIAVADYDFGAATEFRIVQHPLGGHQVLSQMQGPFNVNGNKTRVRYRGNTLNGSSGSAVVDLRGRLVALHHFGHSSTNQGIPISAIAEKIAAGPHASALTPAPAPQPAPGAPAAPIPVVTVDPLATHLFGPRPFVNRANLRNRVRAMLDSNGGSVLVIEGGERAGKSYSYRLLSHVANEHARSPKLQALAAKGIRTVKIDLDEYIGVPADQLRARLADDILAGLGVAAPSDDSLAQAARNITTLKQWLKNRLSNSEILWWIFFDSLDRFVLEQDGVDELIFGLAKLVDEDPSIALRVALVVGDRSDKLPGDLRSWAQKDSAGPLNRDDAASWLRERAKSEGRSVDENKLQVEIAKLFPAGGPNPPAETLAPQLAQTLSLVFSGGP